MNSYILLALGWLKDNWIKLGWPVALAFIYFWMQRGKEIDKLWASIPENPPLSIAQGSTQTAKASVRVQIVYRDREVPAGDAVTPSWKPLPCPDISLEADSSSEQVHWQSVEVKPEAQEGPSEPQQAIFSGLGYLEAPYLELGYRYKDFRVNGKYNLNQNPGFGFTYDWLAW